MSGTSTLFDASLLNSRAAFPKAALFLLGFQQRPQIVLILGQLVNLALAG